MSILIKVALVGDRDSRVIAHRAIPLALTLAAQSLGGDIELLWFATDEIEADPGAQFGAVDGLWCVPASPYRSMEGALHAIRYAREHRLPFLGTCGGFQHAILEYARAALGLVNADLEETHPGSEQPIISRLACALIEQCGLIRLKPGSGAYQLCGGKELQEEYHCSFGLNPNYEAQLEAGGLRVTGRDPAGDVRVIELEGHPFFFGTLFQPERSALRGEAHPLIRGFVAAIVKAVASRKSAVL